jgi:hypothetical protein
MSKRSLTDEARPTRSLPVALYNEATAILAARFARRALIESAPVFGLGLCQCGCGQTTRIIRGQVSQFISGHNSAFRSRPESKKGPVLKIRGKSYLLHRVRAELALGKPLPPGSPVHHVDGTKNEFSPLVICQDRDYHWLLHVRTRIRDAGGNPNTDAICTTCKQVKPRTDFYKTKGRRLGLSTRCKACMRAYSSARNKHDV